MKKKKQGNKYEQIPDQIIDLHGYTQVEARAVVSSALMTARAESLSRVRFITGKGSHSQDGFAVLRESVKQHLAYLGYDYVYAKRDQGGEGVLDVVL
ncbi:MAG: DNA-nicking Smr family endonuclease [Planctomycetota bacterium]|jgi:DNA-nicking Smr family endonuclease